MRRREENLHKIDFGQMDRERRRGCVRGTGDSRTSTGDGARAAMTGSIPERVQNRIRPKGVRIDEFWRKDEVLCADLWVDRSNGRKCGHIFVPPQKLRNG
ncbi:hypothetical protein AAHA92_15704 [Salvia divinorum]|uniref:Uncharacterized protein n=1 Tax=Salvia divinorum TaxID=28513 RepID=A0ABD1HG75_SALDI